MPFHPTAPPAGEEPEPFVEQASDLGRAHRRHPRRRQLDRQRNPVEPPADLAHRDRVRRGEREPGPCRVAPGPRTGAPRRSSHIGVRRLRDGAATASGQICSPRPPDPPDSWPDIAHRRARPQRPGRRDAPPSATGARSCPARSASAEAAMTRQCCPPTRTPDAAAPPAPRRRPAASTPDHRRPRAHRPTHHQRNAAPTPPRPATPRRVLPTPPTPTTVTSRDASNVFPSETSSVVAAHERRHLQRQVPRERVQRAQRREVTNEPVSHELKHRVGSARSRSR